jgi:hypothetical protein
VSPLLKLKKFFTVDEAAQRLSASCGSPMTARDVYQLVYNGELPLAAYFFSRNGIEVAPATHLKNWYSGQDNDPTWFPRLEQNLETGSVRLADTPQSPTTFFSLERQSDEVKLLDGIYQLWLEGPLYLHYVQWLAAGRDANEFDTGFNRRSVRPRRRRDSHTTGGTHDRT